jgi:hypothetical protein
MQKAKRRLPPSFDLQIVETLVLGGGYSMEDRQDSNVYLNGRYCGTEDNADKDVVMMPLLRSSG